MANIQDVSIGAKISFELYPAAQFGNNFQNVTLTAIFNSTIANALGLDVIANNQQVYQSLPAGTPNDPTQYDYFQVKFSSGETVILGAPWVRAGTLIVHNGKRLTLVFEDIDETRKDRIVAACLAQNERPSSTTFV
ncbi:hypothetical protein PHABIO_66 [Pseudomonas phage Phabio]|uniref:SH3 fold domain-containing protein n=1 Tax=Pseudomonas phage Phabio TaxID=2006668 RepID=A0A1Y0T1I5_9CAUD|nr:hypothetical protein MZD05_gp066 [Pseudomonas phage Phabio]ARV76697.1 hypothetical protein PHABIO_66 [Pseudomonas phage Phabio]